MTRRRTPRRWLTYGQEIDRLLLKFKTITRLTDSFRRSVIFIWRDRIMGRVGRYARIECDLGFSIQLDLKEIHDFMMFQSIERNGSYEPGTSLQIYRNLREGDLFVDVGANNGYYSLLAAKCVGPSGRVISFEPNPKALERLHANAALSGFENIEVRPLALSDFDGQARLAVSSFEDGLDTIAFDEMRTPDPSLRSSSQLEVAVGIGDAELANLSVSVIKIDVEGSELRVLEGMKSVIRLNPDLRLVVEWNPQYAGPDLLQFLLSSFRVYTISDGKPQTRDNLREVTSTSELVGLCNLWCVHK